MTPSGETRPCADPAVSSHELDGELLLYDERDHRIHQIGGIGLVIWPFLDGSTSVDELVEDLTDVFGMPEQDVRRDVLALLGALSEAGLLQDGQPTPPTSAATEEDPSEPAYLVDPPAP